MQQRLAVFKPRPTCEVSLTEDRYFEDYVPGTVFEYGEIRVDEAEILDFARRFDPQQMHVDPEAAKRGRFGGLIASGWHTGAIMMRLLADNFLPKAASLASPGIDELRWLFPFGRGIYCASGSRCSKRRLRVQSPTEAWCAL
jgi:acyl dehydratase